MKNHYLFHAVLLWLFWASPTVVELYLFPLNKKAGTNFSHRNGWLDANRRPWTWGRMSVKCPWWRLVTGGPWTQDTSEFVAGKGQGLGWHRMAGTQCYSLLIIYIYLYYNPSRGGRQRGKVQLKQGSKITTRCYWTLWMCTSQSITTPPSEKIGVLFVCQKGKHRLQQCTLDLKVVWMPKGKWKGVEKTWSKLCCWIWWKIVFIYIYIHV